MSSSPALIEAFILNRIVFWGLIIAQLGLVFFLSARVDHLSPAAAAGLFMLYSALVGVTASVILLAYTGASITSTFVIAGGMFGGMAVFGSITKRNLAGWGQFLFMAVALFGFHQLVLLSITVARGSPPLKTNPV